MSTGLLWVILIIIKLTGAVAGLTWTIVNIPLVLIIGAGFLNVWKHSREMAQDRKALQAKFPNLYKREK
tara:strand:- start:519 stop:725 length:207 start_codon:yes stop_codon:yes gene_type:complete